jgi:AcrR family transcriptional regulator
MADISDAVGVSHLIVYRHFASKEQLYEAVIERAHAHLDAKLAAGGMGRFGPSPATLLRIVRSDPPGFVVLWRHAAREPEFRRLHDRSRQRLVDLTMEAMRPHVAKRDRAWAARATVTYLVEATVAWLDDGDPRLDDRFVAATDSALRAGIRSWSATRRS